MLVYRLECDDGSGPFRRRNRKIALCLHTHNDPTEQHMLESVRHTRRQFDQCVRDYVFGWRTQKLAKSFVRKNKRGFVQEQGWKINCYVVSKHSTLRFHDGQVMFRKERALFEKSLSVI